MQRYLGVVRRPRVAMLLAVGAAFALYTAANSSSEELESAFVPAASLEAHGVSLVQVPVLAPAAQVDAASARSTAKAIAALDTDPRETFRIMVRPTALGAPRSAWLFLFEGGEHRGPVGPPDGAESRTFTNAYTGVLIDDQTGDLVFWFQGGSVTP